VAITWLPDMRASLALYPVALIHSIDERIEKVAVLPSQSHMKESLGCHQSILLNDVEREGITGSPNELLRGAERKPLAPHCCPMSVSVSLVSQGAL